MDVASNKSKDATKTAVKQKAQTEYVQDKAAAVYGV